MPLLEAREIHSGYGGMEVLHGVSVTLAAGELVTIIGPNGAGKSTLLKTMFGLLTPTQGTVSLGEEDITGAPPHRIVRHGMCYVPQVDNVFPSLTVEENLQMGAFILRGGIEARLARVYELFPVLKDRRRQRVGKMSGGERQMVAMGRALMLDPQVLLLDEPTAALAPNLVEQVFQSIQAIVGSGVGVLMVEQNARQSLAIADRGYVLVDGRNRREGSGQELLADEEIGRLFLGG
ncbi:TPA: ABC transporter ATP-binding protein [Candidatus Bipolaricaulota bacterium]|nr:ABC transporter ATP-binding protein [Candidatus Bipolaricaulota bacterium]